MKPITPSEALQQKKKVFIRRKSLRVLAVSMSCTFLATLILLGVVFGLASVRGSSMAPSIKERDIVLFSRLSEYTAGDIIIIHSDDDKELIKRVICLPGDVIDIFPDGKISVNGELIEDPYAAGFTDRKDSLEYPIVLGTDEYFVLGDNREDSRDSRFYGPIKKANIRGKVITILRTNKQEI